MYRVGRIAQQVDQNADDGRLVADHVRVLRQIGRNLDALEVEPRQTDG